MKPVVVVVGRTYADARQYVLTNMDTRPALHGARLVSASCAAAARGLMVSKVYETPGARLGRDYAEVMAHLRTASAASLVPLR
jgi:hypothetical protein